MICSTESGRSSVYQNGSTTMRRASGRAARIISKSRVIAASISSARDGIEKLSLSPMVLITMSGLAAMTWSIRSSPRRWFTKPRPLRLGLTSVQSRSAETMVDQRLSAAEPPVPRV